VTLNDPLHTDEFALEAAAVTYDERLGVHHSGHRAQAHPSNEQHRRAAILRTRSPFGQAFILLSVPGGCMSRTRVAVLGLALLAVAPSQAFADATLFLGANTSPENRMVRGFAFGMSLLVVGFEFEYANTSDSVEAAAPSLRTGSGNLLLQTPFEVFGMQPYFTAGAGFYRERFESSGHQETNVTMSSGGGVKVSLLGPVRLRLDYRVFRLSGGARTPPAHPEILNYFEKSFTRARLTGCWPVP
jgi:opacity protein-like surface antigen